MKDFTKLKKISRFDGEKITTIIKMNTEKRVEFPCDRETTERNGMRMKRNLALNRRIAQAIAAAMIANTVISGASPAMAGISRGGADTELGMLATDSDADRDETPDETPDEEQAQDTSSDKKTEANEILATMSVAQRAISKSIYYVDAENGSDENDGLSEESAWKTFKNVNKRSFQPGDTILLKAGCVWNEILNPKGSGKDGAPITIDMYGEGAKPRINGNGTKGPTLTGAVLLYNQEFWEIYNLEVTNLESTDKAGELMDSGTSERAGILIYSDNQTDVYEHIVIKNCYVHDVNSNWKGGKTSGGIIVIGNYMDMDGNVVTIDDAGNPTTKAMGRAAFKDVLIEGNYVKNVAIEGIRNKCNTNITASGWGSNEFLKNFSDVTIRNNYLEDVVGDGIVLTECVGGLVEGNIVNNSCGANRGTVNYAQCWTMFADDITIQYNEVYGNKYGYDDGEAFDSDMRNENNIFQYNLSHDNGGGACLFMSSQKNTIFRYNVSVNDGTGTYPSNNYMQQQTFHYDSTSSNNPGVPDIYNNTIYVGNGKTTSLFGGKSARTNFIKFRNNIVLAENDSKITFTVPAHKDIFGTNQKDSTIHKDSIIENNCIWPESIGEGYGVTVEKLKESGNIFADPKLKNPSVNTNSKDYTEYVYPLDKMDELADSDFTKERVQKMAEPWQLTEGSPCIQAGQRMDDAPETDLFGNTIAGRVDIGAHEFSSEDEHATSVESPEILTFPGIAPELPSTLKVTLEDGSEISYPVKWEALTENDYAQTGELNVKGELPGLSNEAVAKVYIRDSAAFEEVSVKTRAGVYPSLPEKVKASFDDGAFELEVKVQWPKLSFDDYKTAGTHEIEGTVEGLESVCIAKLEVIGNVGEGHTTENRAVKQDAYIQKSTGTAMDSKVLKVKNAKADAYNRRTLMQFDLEGLEELIQNATSITLRLHTTRYDKDANWGFSDPLKETYRLLRIYDVDDDWDENTVTWANAPTLDDSRIVLHDEKIVNSDIQNNDDVLEIDLADYIKSAVEKGDKTVSMLMGVFDNTPFTSGDNSGFDFASKENTEFEGPTLMITDTYIQEVEDTELETPATIAPTLPSKVTVVSSDGTEIQKNVVWESISKADYQTPGNVFEIRGKVDGTEMPAICRITVTERPAEILSVKEIPEIIQLLGTAEADLPLPEEVTVVLDNGDEMNVPIKDGYWFPDVAYDPNLEQSYIYKGYLDLSGITTVRNTAGVEASVVVKIVEAEDKYGLMVLYTQAVAYMADGKVDKLVASVREEFMEALQDVKDAIEDTYASEAKVHAAYTKLMNALWKLDQKENIKADTKRLENLILVAESKDKALYTKESYEEMTDVLAEAKELLKQDITSAEQDTVDDIADRLDWAIFSLAVKDDEHVNEVKSIKVVGKPDKTEYLVGEALDTKGLTVYAVYADGMEKEVKNYTIEKPDMDKIGAYSVVIRYEGFATSYQIEVREKLTKADTAELEELLLLAERKDASLYTSKTYQAMKQVLDEAKALLEQELTSAQQAAVDAMVEKLEAAIDALREKSTSGGGSSIGGASSNGGSSSSGKSSGKPIVTVNEPGVTIGTWGQNETNWTFRKQSGSNAKSEWIYTGWNGQNSWYYFGADEQMCRGWQSVNGVWYYLNESGAMQTGWQLVNNKWYYLNQSGAMQTGWQFVNNKWYYMQADGSMLADTVTPDGYRVGADGAMQ